MMPDPAYDQAIIDEMFSMIHRWAELPKGSQEQTEYGEWMKAFGKEHPAELAEMRRLGDKARKEFRKRRAAPR